MRQLSGTDTTMLVAERPHTPNHMACLTVYDQSTAPGGLVTFKQILERVGERLHVSPALRRRLVTVPFNLDRPYWLDDPDFDIEFHIRHIALPKPGDWRQFCILVARLGARPLDLVRPPWEMWVIEGLDAVEGVPPGSFATFFKLHHATMDGTATNAMFMALHDRTPDGVSPAPESDWTPEHQPSPWPLLARAAVHSATRPVEFVRMLGANVPTLPGRFGRAIGKRKLPAGLPTATRFNRAISPHRVWIARWYPFDEVKGMRRVVPGSTVNDVALTIVGGAMRRYLLDKGELPDEPLLATVPISVRAADAAGEGGNQFAMMSVPMGTDIEDAVERLVTIQRTTSEAKGSRALVDAPSVMQMAELLPATIQSLASRTLIGGMARMGRAASHTVVTNVPGSPYEMYFCGAKAILPIGMAPIVDGMGLMQVISSYAGKLFTVMITSDRDMMPDPQFYSDCIDESYGELAKAAADV